MTRRVAARRRDHRLRAALGDLRARRPDAADRGRQHQHARPLPSRRRDRRRTPRGLPARPRGHPVDGPERRSTTSSRPSSARRCAQGRRRWCRRSCGRRSSPRSPSRGDHLVVYSSGERALLDALRASGRALPRLRDARRPGRGHDRRQPRVPAALERGLRRGSADRARRGRRRRLLAAQRGGLPRQAGALGPAARPVRAADERALPGARGLRALRHRADTPRSSDRSSSGSTDSSERLAGYEQDGNVECARRRSSARVVAARRRPRRPARPRARHGGAGARRRDERTRRTRIIGGGAALGAAARPASPSTAASTRPRSSTARRSAATRGRPAHRADLRRRPEPGYTRGCWSSSTRHGARATFFSDRRVGRARARADPRDCRGRARDRQPHLHAPDDAAALGATRVREELRRCREAVEASGRRVLDASTARC